MQAACLTIDQKVTLFRNSCFVIITEDKIIIDIEWVDHLKDKGEIGNSTRRIERKKIREKDSINIEEISLSHLKIIEVERKNMITGRNKEIIAIEGMAFGNRKKKSKKNIHFLEMNKKTITTIAKQENNLNNYNCSKKPMYLAEDVNSLHLA